MPVSMKRFGTILGGFSLCALACLTTQAHAATDITIILEVDGVAQIDPDLGFQTGGSDNGVFTNYESVITTGAYEFDYSVNANGDVSNPFLPSAWIGGAFTIFNNTAQTHEYSVTVLVDLDSAIASSLYDASVTGNITAVDGATFTTDGFGFSALYNGSSVWDGWNDLNVSTPAFTSAPLPSESASGNANPFPPTLPGGFVSQIGITFTFELTAFDQAGFDGDFFVAPGPGGLALLAVGGLFGRRRRRSR